MCVCVEFFSVQTIDPGCRSTSSCKLWAIQPAPNSLVKWQALFFLVVPRTALFHPPTTSGSFFSVCALIPRVDLILSLLFVILSRTAFAFYECGWFGDLT